jgi:hypothetical protein
VNDGDFASATCEMPEAGPTWINGLVVLCNQRGKERMFAGYGKFRLVVGIILDKDARSREIAFFAPDRAGLAMVPILEHRDENTG